MTQRPRLATPREVRWLRVAASVTALGVLVLAAPLIWTALKATAGLILLAGLALVGGATLHALPYFGQLLENRLLRARIAAARDNPIEQLQNQLLQRSAQVERYRESLSAIYAQIAEMQLLLDTRRELEPAHDLSKQAAALGKMSAFYASHVQKLEAARCALRAYENQLASKRFEWAFAQAGRRALENLNPRDQESLVRELLGDEATRAVQFDFNRVFAELDSELLEIRGVAVQL
jgi:hypothetical protein